MLEAAKVLMPKRKVYTYQHLRLFLFGLLLLGTALSYPSYAWAEPAQRIELAGAHLLTLSGDEPAFAQPEFDDSAWTRVAVPLSLRAAGKSARTDVFWYRIKFTVPHDWTVAAPAFHTGPITRSDETYLNGVKIGATGQIGPRLSDWHDYAPTQPRLYPFDPALLRPGETNVLAIRGAREPYVDDGGIVSGPVALVSLPSALPAFQTSNQRIQALRFVIFGVETLTVLVLLICAILGLRSRFLLLFQFMYFPSYLFSLEQRGVLNLLGFQGPGLQFAANICGALALPVLIEFSAHVLKRRVGKVGRAIQVLSVVTLFSISGTGVTLLDWWAIESHLVWHILLLCGLLLISAWSGSAFLNRQRYALTMLVGLSILTASLGLHLVGSVNLLEEYLGHRVGEIGIQLFFLSLAVIVAQSILQRERSLRAANADITDLHEQERARMAYDVHDGLGQYLSTMKLRVDLLQRSEDKEQLPSDVNIGELVSELELAIRDTRRLAYDLSPPMLTERGLIGALHSLVEKTRSASGIHIALEVANSVFLNDAASIHVYRILQEALNNAISHSQATQIRVELKQSARDTRLLVTDNGCGLPSNTAPRTTKASAGLGLRSMTNRAKLLGGTLTIGKAEPSGVEIELLFPTMLAQVPKGDQHE